MKYKIIVDKQSRLNPSTEKREYEIDIEELRAKGNVYDSLVITKEEDYVMRRLSLSEFHVLSVLDEPVKEPIKGINIELFEGDNYIYLVDMSGNKFYAEYLIKNEFNDLYVIHSEMNSAINQSAKEIEIGVNQKLTNYSTTEEMNAAIKVLSDAIALEVAKKVNNEDLTSANIILRINEDDSSEAQISADKLSLIGKILNLADNMQIKSNHFNVASDGKTRILAGQSNTDIFVVQDEENSTNKTYLQPGGAGFVGAGGSIDIQSQRENFDFSYISVQDSNGTTNIQGKRHNNTDINSNIIRRK